jgi:single-stranded-DNA-specific exonuclease
MSKWMICSKRADFKGIGEKYGVDQVVARIARNRDNVTEEDFEEYFSQSTDSLHNPALLKDAVEAVEIICEKIAQNRKIRVIGDYDIDGVCSTTILVKGLRAVGADVDFRVPDRVLDGYGLNVNMIDEAIRDGIDTIVTCDNGISAKDEIKYGKENGLTIVVTDHHAIPFELDEDGETKHYLVPECDAVVDAQQSDCQYPFKLMCGGGVAYQLMRMIFVKIDNPDYKFNRDLINDAKYSAFDDCLSDDRKRLLRELRQLAAVATVGDIVDLKDENRRIVKFGLQTMKNTENRGIRALAECCQVDLAKLSTYHISFVLGPCLNAIGRLDTANKAVELLTTDSAETAMKLAQELKATNDERKQITDEGLEEASRLIESGEGKDDKVLVVYLPSCHESVAGLIASKIKERYYKPTFIITDSTDGAKGSGRSIEGYNMAEELGMCRELLTKFGGHPMAAGLSIEKDNIDKLREKLNANITLDDETFIPVKWIDVPMPLSYVTFDIIEQISRLEPFGKGNDKPTFADKNLVVRGVNVLGKNRNVLKMTLEDEYGKLHECIQFGTDENAAPERGSKISILYYPDINEFNGRRTIQFVVSEWN